MVIFAKVRFCIPACAQRVTAFYHIRSFPPEKRYTTAFCREVLFYEKVWLVDAVFILYTIGYPLCRVAVVP